LWQSVALWRCEVNISDRTLLGVRYRDKIARAGKTNRTLEWKNTKSLRLRQTRAADLSYTDSESQRVRSRPIPPAALDETGHSHFAATQRIVHNVSSG